MSRTGVSLAAAAAAVLMLAAPGTTSTTAIAPDQGVTSARPAWSEVTRALKKIGNVEGILGIRRSVWACQDAVEFPRAKAAHGRAALLTAGPGYRRWVADRWRTMRQQCEEVKRRTIPAVQDWLTAVQVAQRAYPGTSGWLISCSDDEGGHGGWVPNSQGSGAGGWMQFMEGTFWRMWGAAKAELEERGFRLPASLSSWYSPVGQALAGAWGVSNGRAHEWVAPGC